MRSQLSFLIPILLLVAAPATAQTTYTWTGTTGSWNDPVRWEPNGVPGAGDIVNISSGTATLGDLEAVEAEVGLRAAALLGGARPRVIDEDEAHRARGQREEVGAVLPRRARLVYQLEVGLVDERGGVERLAGAVLEQPAVGDAAKLLVDVGPEGLAGVGVPSASAEQEVRRVGRSEHGRPERQTLKSIGGAAHCQRVIPWSLAFR